MRRERCCGTCGYHRPDDAGEEWVCTNPDSEYRSDWTDYEWCCDDYEEGENE